MPAPLRTDPPVSRLSRRTFRGASLPSGYAEDLLVFGVEFGPDYISVPDGVEIFIESASPHSVSIWKTDQKVARVDCMGAFTFNQSLNIVVPDNDGDVELLQGNWSLSDQHQGLAWAWIRVSI